VLLRYFSRIAPGVREAAQIPGNAGKS